MLGDSISDFITVSKSSFRISHHDFDGIPRITFISLFILACFLILFAALINSQIFSGSYYRNLANNNRIRNVPIHAPRGIIMDRNNISLTANLPSFRFNNTSVSKDQAIELEAAGKQPEVDSKRSYLYGPVFAHVLGYIQEFAGQDGLEKYYENLLRGTDGKELLEVDATGKNCGRFPL